MDCSTQNAYWASVNNGCFLCINCGGKHRGFGKNISFVRSTTLDAWTQQQITMMEYGGNERLRKFWKKQKIPFKKLSLKLKYNNKAMDEYRECLNSINPIETIF